MGDQDPDTPASYVGERRGAPDVAEIVLSAVAKNVDPARSTELSPQTPLTELGIDSLGIAGLIVDLEQALGTRLPAEMIDKHVFHSARTIADAVGAIITETA